MKAMILAAGKGTRLRPLTNYQPKALVKVAGVPLLEVVIRQLKRYGCKDIIVNVHHFGDQIIQFLKRKDNFGINIAISDEREELLDTGGGLKKAASFFSDGQPFLLCNTDILSDLNLKDFYEAHCRTDAIASLAIQWRETSRYLIFAGKEENLLLHGWGNIKTGVLKIPKHTVANYQMLAFSGLHVIDPRLFNYMPEAAKFSIIDVYLKACASEKINGFRCDEQQWMDIGRKSSLDAAEPLANALLADI